MDFNQIITIASVVITLVSIFIAIYQVLESRKGFLSISKGRRMAIEGSWKGVFKQDNLVEGKELTGKMELNISIKGKFVIGTGTYGGNFGEQTKYEENIQLKGGFKQDRFLVLDYHNVNNSKMHFGHFILQLSSEGDHLKGKLIAFGHKSEAIIAADIDLNKVG